jgi:nucleotide-binding universal stress UspA family protein
VVERPPGLPSDVIVKPEPDAVPVSVHEWLDGQARRALPPLHADLVEFGVDARDLVRHGDVVDTILAVADEVDARMIVMGTEGRKGLQRLILGSVAERVVRRSSRPVMTVRAAPQA